MWCDLPVISTYLAASRMMLFPTENAHYQTFKQKLDEAKPVLSDAEMKGCYMLSVNYCIKRANGGDEVQTRSAAQVLSWRNLGDVPVM